MTFKIEMNNLFNFFVRRKWILILTTIITAIIFSGLMYFSSTEKNGQDGANQETATKQYYSYFTFIVENPQNGNSLMNLGTLKTALTTDDSIRGLNNAGFSLNKKDLDYTLNLFTNGNSGETIYLIVRNTSEENVKIAVNYYYDLLVNKKNDYFSQKNIFYLSKPSVPGFDLPVQQFYTSTDTNLFAVTNNNNAVTKQESKIATNLLYGIGIGLVLGFLLAFVRDITDKKIHGTSYIYPLFQHDSVDLIDLTFEEKSVSIKKINILLNNNSENNLVVSEADSQWINHIKEISKHSKIEINELTPQFLEGINEVYLLVQKHFTTSKWLREQLVLLSDSTKKLSIIFVDKP